MSSCFWTSLQRIPHSLYIWALTLSDTTHTTSSLTAYSAPIGPPRLQSHRLPIKPKTPRGFTVWCFQMFVFHSHNFIHTLEGTSHFISLEWPKSLYSNWIIQLMWWSIQSATATVIFCPTPRYDFLTSFWRYDGFPAVTWRIMKITITYLPTELLRMFIHMFGTL